MEKKQALSYKDLTQILGVSRAQLDRVLHNREGVSEKTRAELLSKIEALGFFPNVTGKALAMQKKMTFGVILNADLTPEGSTIYPLIRRGMERAAEKMQKNGAKFIFTALEKGTVSEQIEKIHELIENECSVIALSCIEFTPEMVETIHSVTDSGVKIVFYYNTNTVQCVDNVHAFAVPSDNKAEGELAAKLMRKMLNGHGKVVLVSGMLQNLVHQKRIGNAVSYFNESCPDIQIEEVYSNVYPREMALRIAEQIKRDHSDADGIIISCGYNAEVVETLSQMEKHPRIITFDFTERAEHLLKAQSIDAVIGTNLKKVGFDTIMAVYHFMIDGSVDDFEVSPVIEVKMN